ncbi:MAG: uroporphyrinogen decarboxylase family protein [Candidatus Zhuqueibacterota bacterium]
MSASLTSRERFQRMFEHRDADRVPIIDDPWNATIERWQNEGMPANAHYVEFFGLDYVADIYVDNSPGFEKKVIEETGDYVIYTTEWGATLKNWKHAASTPEFIDFTLKDRESWRKFRERIRPDADRVNWDYLRKNYAAWKKQGYWIQTCLWFGFDVTHSWIVGTEKLLMALVEDPQWCVDIFSHTLETNLSLMDRVWDAGYHFDSVRWPDDMGYKHNQFFSIAMYRELLKPFHRRAIEWAHRKGVKAHLHSCGDVNPFIPEFIEMGLDGLNPLEVKAGMDAVHLKKTYGQQLLLHGGINAVLWDDREAIEQEILEKVPRLKESGGYIFSSDHSVPSSVSLTDFQYIVDLAKRVGAY